jgi:hypothetical protein
VIAFGHSKMTERPYGRRCKESSACSETVRLGLSAQRMYLAWGSKLPVIGRSYRTCIYKPSRGNGESAFEKCPRYNWITGCVIP